MTYVGRTPVTNMTSSPQHGEQSHTGAGATSHGGDQAIVFHVRAAEAYSTVGDVAGADSSLPGRVVDLLTAASRNVETPMMSDSDLDDLIDELS